MRRIFGTDEARNFKFGTRIEPCKSHLMNDKIHRRAHGQGLGAEFLNFKPLSVNFERVKLEMSSLIDDKMPPNGGVVRVCDQIF